MNIFNWSIPFVSEKIDEMLLQIIKKVVVFAIPIFGIISIIGLTSIVGFVFYKKRKTNYNKRRF